MKRLFGLLSILLSVALSVVASDVAAPTPKLEMSLSLVRDTTLPGIPVEFRVTVTNLSHVPVEVPPFLRLRVEPADGAVYYARTLDPHTLKPTASVGGWPSRQVPPLGSKERTEILFPVDTLLAGPEWFVDSRLNMPGVYRLQLVAYPRFPSKDEPVSQIVSADRDDDGGKPIVSNAVTLTVRVPEGEDAQVWEKMQELAGAGGWVPAMHLETGLAQFVWQNHPTSYYLHYLAPLVKTGEEEFIRGLKQAIGIDPNGPHSESLKFVLAHFYTRLAEEAIYGGRGGLVKAYEYADLANAAYRDLLADVKTPESRKAAELGLAAVPDRAQLKELHELAKKQQK